MPKLKALTTTARLTTGLLLLLISGLNCDGYIGLEEGILIWWLPAGESPLAGFSPWHDFAAVGLPCLCPACGPAWQLALCSTAIDAGTVIFQAAQDIMDFLR